MHEFNGHVTSAYIQNSAESHCHPSGRIHNIIRTYRMNSPGYILKINIIIRWIDDFGRWLMSEHMNCEYDSIKAHVHNRNIYLSRIASRIHFTKIYCRFIILAGQATTDAYAWATFFFAFQVFYIQYFCNKEAENIAIHIRMEVSRGVFAFVNRQMLSLLSRIWTRKVENEPHERLVGSKAEIQP